MRVKLGFRVEGGGLEWRFLTNCSKEMVRRIGRIRNWSFWVRRRVPLFESSYKP
jgi:hypothetical protein